MNECNVVVLSIGCFHVTLPFLPDGVIQETPPLGF